MKSLKEVYNFSSKSVLKEEIDYSTKKAIVYHLCGEKVGVPDPLDVAQSVHGRRSTGGDREATQSFLSNLKQTKPWMSEPAEDTSDPRITRDKSKRAGAIKRNIERGAFKKHYTDINSLQGKAHYLAKSVMTDPYSTGSSFMAGGGKMYGKGLYTCYEFNPKIARTYGDVILRFEVDLTNYMIFTEEIAKKIHGENYRLEDQLREILNRRGYDFEKLMSDKGFSNFVDYLKTKTEDFPFKNSTTKTRTAPLCLEALQYCSYYTDEKILLRRLIEGVLFQGIGDGPVCVIYYPEIATNYIMTGAGYFHPDTQEPIIHDDIEELVNRKSSVQLKDYIQIQDEELSGNDRQEIVQDQIDQNKKAIDVYLNREPEAKEENAMKEISSLLKKIFATELMTSKISQKIIEKRDAHTGGKVLNSAAAAIAGIIFEIKMLPSEIMAPVIPAIEAISGKKVDILSKEELVGYLTNLRKTKIRRKRKFNSFEELRAGYEAADAGTQFDSQFVPQSIQNKDNYKNSFPLMLDENVDQKTLDLIYDAALHMVLFRSMDFNKINKNVLTKIKTFVEGMDYGYLGPDFLQLLNIKTELPVDGGGFHFYKDDDASIEDTHRQLNEIEEEMPEIKSIISNIHDLLRSSQNTLLEFNEAASDCDLYIKQSFEKYTALYDEAAPESFGLASLPAVFNWASNEIDIAMTFLYAFAESGRIKNFNSIIESGNKVLVRNISPKEIFSIFGLDEFLGQDMLDYIDYPHDDSSDNLYAWNMTNKNSIISNMIQDVREGLVEELAENIVICSDMGSEEFLYAIDPTGGGINRLSDLKI